MADVVAYFCANYPHKAELSNARLTKMVYLSDWRSAIRRGRQITDIRWKFNHFGPYVDDVLEAARKDKKRFVVADTINMYGNPKQLIQLRESAEVVELSKEDREILDHVIEETRPLYWNDFIKLVYSTYPVLTQERYEELDLVALAKEYAETEELFA